MILVEGMQLNGKRITGSQIRKAWTTISSKPLPKIKAITLSNEDFNHIIDVKRCPEDDMREIEEWGEFSQQDAQMLAFLTLTKQPKGLNT